MSLGLLGNKIGMTQIFDESGNIIPVTILKIGPCVVTQIKTILTDGYNAIQVGYGSVSKKYLNQPELGHLQKANIQPLKYLKEFHVTNPETFKVGQIINLECFEPGQFVNITGKTSGKGFSGLQKRHNRLPQQRFKGSGPPGRKPQHTTDDALQPVRVTGTTGGNYSPPPLFRSPRDCHAALM